MCCYDSLAYASCRRPLVGAGAQLPIDTDGDGQISLPEIQAVRPSFGADDFNTADTDANGYLSRDELRALRRGRGEGPRAGRRGPPPMLDTDGDGALSLDELRARASRHDRRGVRSTRSQRRWALESR